MKKERGISKIQFEKFKNHFGIKGKDKRCRRKIEVQDGLRKIREERKMRKLRISDKSQTEVKISKKEGKLTGRQEK